MPNTLGGNWDVTGGGCLSTHSRIPAEEKSQISVCEGTSKGKVGFSFQIIKDGTGDQNWGGQSGDFVILSVRAQ